MQHLGERMEIETAVNLENFEIMLNCAKKYIGRVSDREASKISQKQQLELGYSNFLELVDESLL
ncbi:MAG: hypothetical protein PWP39_1079 [Pyrococcus sp.]|nr:hypothetical protein [Pyrococcus sp.]